MSSAPKFTPRRADAAVLAVLRAGGRVWRSNASRGRTAWLCPPRGPSRRVRLFTLERLESAGAVEAVPSGENDTVWTTRAALAKARGES